jgi:hypothetical protein
MITIFCDFWQFSAKKLAFFSKTNVLINFFQTLALFWVKNAIFCWIFRRKYLKNHNIGPWSDGAVKWPASWHWEREFESPLGRVWGARTVNTLMALFSWLNLHCYCVIKGVFTRQKKSWRATWRDTIGKNPIVVATWRDRNFIFHVDRP